MQQQLTSRETVKVYAMYAPCGVIFQGELQELKGVSFSNICDFADVTVNEEFAEGEKLSMPTNCFDEIQLLLTPLSKITDEHALAVYGMGYNQCSKGLQIKPLSEWSKMMYDQHQYLIQQGYAVSLFFGINHWANGKTAIELGIAIDKTIHLQNQS